MIFFISKLSTILYGDIFLFGVAQLEKAKQREIQSQQMEEQRQKFKLKTQNLLKFMGEPADNKSARVGRKKKERSGDIFSEGEDGEASQPAPKRRK